MKAHLLYRSSDCDWKWVQEATAAREASRSGWRARNKSFDWQAGVPWNAEALIADLGLDTIFTYMAQGDDCVFEASRKILLEGIRGDLDTIRYRQTVLQDCLNQPAVVRELYAIAVEALDKQKKHYLGVLSRYPDYVLRDGVDRISEFLVFLTRMRKIADEHAHEFVSDGWTEFFAMLKRELDDAYLQAVEGHVQRLRFRNDALLLSAKLSTANKGDDYVLHKTLDQGWTWWSRLTSALAPKSPAFSFTLYPRDEAGLRALAELRNRGVAVVAVALGQSADHVSDFFGMLRAELAFYVGCINLYERLARTGEPTFMPDPVADDRRKLEFRGLYDVALSLSVEGRVVGSDADADGKSLLVITGANSGGKSTFLRSLGIAQLMMQCGMFVGAEAFTGSVSEGVFTHFKREEDAGMVSGKFDEELGRMSEIVDHVDSDAMILFNESFAATNEREGSEVGRQIIGALLDRSVRVACVTHLNELAEGFVNSRGDSALFLRAGREPDGTRTFKMEDGKPLPTSYGADLYATIFGPEPS